MHLPSRPLPNIKVDTSVIINHDVTYIFVPKNLCLIFFIVFLGKTPETVLLGQRVGTF